MIGLLLLPEASTQFGVGAARRNRVPRWLVEIHRLDQFFFLSNVPGKLTDVSWPDGYSPTMDGVAELTDVYWDQGIITVQDSAREVNLDEMSMPLASCTIHMTPDMRRFFDPMIDLAQALVRISYYDGKVVRYLVRGNPDENSIGFDGETVSFSVIEKWRTNPLFPRPINEVGVRVSADRVAESSESQVYPYAFGHAWAVPALLIRSFGEDDPEGGNARYMIHGTSLTRTHDVTDDGRDPVPYVGFHHEAYPAVGPLKASTIIGGWYGRNRMLRDAFEKTGMSPEWEVVEGTFAQNESGSTNLETTDSVATCTTIWTDWNYEESLSLTMRVQAIDAEAVVCVYWNYVDDDNHARVEFKFGSKRIRAVVREAGVDTVKEKKKLGEDVDDVDEATETTKLIPEDDFRLTVDVTAGKLSAGVKEGDGTGTEATIVEFGEIAAAVGGRLGIGSRAGKVRFVYLSQPSMKAQGQTETDVNASIRHRKDLLNHSIVCEDYKDQPAESMYYNFNRAQNMSNTGQLLERLVRDYSGLSEENIDFWTFDRLVEDLRRFKVGAYFNEQQPIFDIITIRLSKQFMFVIQQEAGMLKGLQFDPTLQPARKLIYGIDLLELTEPIREYEKFNEFKVRWKFNAARNEWGKSAELTSENFLYFEAHRRRYGHNPYPVEIDLPDVVTDGTGEHILLMYAMIFHAGQRAVYLQRASDGGDIQLGEVVELVDPARGWMEKRAFFVGREVTEPGYVRNVFRTIEFFEEAGSGGASFTEGGAGNPPSLEPVPILVEEWDMEPDEPESLAFTE